MLPDFNILSNLDAINFLNRKNTLVITPTDELLSSRATQNMPNVGYLA